MIHEGLQFQRYIYPGTFLAEEYAHCLSVVVFCCCLAMIVSPLSFTVTSKAREQSRNYPNANEGQLSHGLPVTCQTDANMLSTMAMNLSVNTSAVVCHKDLF